MNLIFDLYQQSCITQVSNKAAEAKDEASRLRSQVEDLQRRLDTLILASQAMWELLRQRCQLGDADLMEKMQEVDLRDGEADGRITTGAVGCPNCGRRSRSTRRLCVYCGATLPAHHMFTKE